LIRKVADNYRLPYFTLSPTFSICPSHGYLDGEQKTCSICHQETEVYSRVVGYLRPIKQWNSGKQAEYGDRKTFNVAKDADGGSQITDGRRKRLLNGEVGIRNAEWGMQNEVKRSWEAEKLKAQGSKR
jgi:hypothetical protein